MLRFGSAEEIIMIRSFCIEFELFRRDLRVNETRDVIFIRPFLVDELLERERLKIRSSYEKIR